MYKTKFIFLIAVLFAQITFAQESPVPMLENSANNIIATLKHNQGSLKSDPQIVNKAITVYLLPHVDIQGMSRSVLGRQNWNKISSSERQDFTTAFTQLVVRTYAVPLAGYSGETVKFKPLRGDVNQRFTQVNSVIYRPNGQKIPLSYSLVAKKEGWKVYDVSIEGVSLLQSFRSQFNASLKTESMRALIQKMNKTKKAV
ncbi:MAG: ABC transporter substrate-binding protein [Legionellaceae bacterium]|nr:ABC transporter substrate-binding protein [Legionellaceae bacterium]